MPCVGRWCVVDWLLDVVHHTLLDDFLAGWLAGWLPKRWWGFASPIDGIARFHWRVGQLPKAVHSWSILSAICVVTSVRGVTRNSCSCPCSCSSYSRRSTPRVWPKTCALCRPETRLRSENAASRCRAARRNVFLSPEQCTFSTVLLGWGKCRGVLARSMPPLVTLVTSQLPTFSHNFEPILLSRNRDTGLTVRSSRHRSLCFRQP